MEIQKLLRNCGPEMVLDEYFGEVCKWDGSAQNFSLHSLAFFWACADGLGCHHPEYQIAIFVLLNLHSQKYNIVSTIITKSIIIHLSKDVPKNWKDAFRSKYLHISFITKMAAHQSLELFDSHNRSFHSLGTNQ